MSDLEHRAVTLRPEDIEDLEICVRVLRGLSESAPVLHASGNVISPEALTRAVARIHGLLERLWYQANGPRSIMSDSNTGEAT